MTHYVNMQVTHIFLAHAKNSLESMVPFNDKSGFPPEELYQNAIWGTGMIVSCVGAVESYVNIIFDSHTEYLWYDSLRLNEKIEALCQLHGCKIDKSRDPYQTFLQIVGIRNWLMHFKREVIGLMGAEGSWVTNSDRIKKPNMDPLKIFTQQQCRRYYDCTRNMVELLGKAVHLDNIEYDFVKNEQYDPFLIG